MGMEIRNIRHKGLKAFVARGQTKGLPAAYVEKIRDIMIFLLDMEEIDEVFDLKKYKPHRLTGDRAGTFSLSVTPNWRITFGCDAAANERIDVDYEDYH
jgi:proteic killer suppression protein